MADKTPPVIHAYLHAHHSPYLREDEIVFNSRLVTRCGEDKSVVVTLAREHVNCPKCIAILAGRR